MPPLHILLVEDNPTDALLVDSALDEMVGWEPVLTHRERLSEATVALRQQKFDVVLLDLNLPDGQGLDNFTRLQDVSPATPVIMLTGLADEVTALKALQRGAADYILKGETDARLLERSVRYAIERKKQENSRMELARARIARAEAEAANRSKDEFLATLSHELRTPLNAILGWASLLRGGQLGPADATQALETIERNARVQAQLIEDLLDVSRIIAGNLKLTLTNLQISDVAHIAVDALKPAADRKKIQVRVVASPALPVRGDATRLQQVIWNLVSNAIKFTPPHGEVTVEVAPAPKDRPSGVEVRVVDSGQGIEPGFLPHVFDRFRQADSSATRRHGGLGLGLAIVRHLVEMHGGQVSALSPGTGLGATFAVFLPYSKDQPDADNPTLGLNGLVVEVGSPDHHRSSLGHLLRGIRILTIDDDDDTREFVRTTFARVGAEIKAADGPAEALDMIAKWTPQIILCDIGIPGMDGCDLLHALRRVLPNSENIPAVALTAYASAGEQQRFLEAGFAGFIPKPTTSEALQESVAALYFAGQD